MDLDGFHVTDHRGHVGEHAPALAVERSSPMPAKERNAWKYHDSIPESAKIQRYFYGYDDLETLTQAYITDDNGQLHEIMGWTERDVKAKQRKHGWRWRLDHTTRRREFYLYDLLATDFAYMLDWHGNRIDPELLAESREYIRARGSIESNTQLDFMVTWLSSVVSDWLSSASVIVESVRPGRLAMSAHATERFKARSYLKLLRDCLMYKKPEQVDPLLQYARANHELLKKIEAHLSMLVGHAMTTNNPVPSWDATKDTETREQ